MGDGCRQLADGGKFLRVQVLLLRLLQLAGAFLDPPFQVDVDRLQLFFGQDQLADVAGRGIDEPCRRVMVAPPGEPADGAVPAAVAVANDPRAVAGQAAADLGQGPLQVLGMDQRGQRAAEQFGLGIAEQFPAGRVDPAQAPVRLEDAHQVGRGGEQLQHLLQFLFGLFTGGDVPGDAAKTLADAVCIVPGLAAHLDHHRPAVGAHHLLLHPGKGLAGGESATQLFPEDGGLVRLHQVNGRAAEKGLRGVAGEVAEARTQVGVAATAVDLPDAVRAGLDQGAVPGLARREPCQFRAGRIALRPGAAQFLDPPLQQGQPLEGFRWQTRRPLVRLAPGFLVLPLLLSVRPACPWPVACSHVRPFSTGDRCPAGPAAAWTAAERVCKIACGRQLGNRPEEIRPFFGAVLVSAPPSGR